MADIFAKYKANEERAIANPSLAEQIKALSRASYYSGHLCKSDSDWWLVSHRDQMLRAFSVIAGKLEAQLKAEVADFAGARRDGG